MYIVIFGVTAQVGVRKAFGAGGTTIQSNGSLHGGIGEKEQD